MKLRNLEAAGSAGGYSIRHVWVVACDASCSPGSPMQWSSMKAASPFISSSQSTQSTVASLTHFQHCNPVWITKFLIRVIVIRPECERAKGLQSVGLEQQRRAALGALQSQIDVVQCLATVHCVKSFSPIWTTSLKSYVLELHFFQS